MAYDLSQGTNGLRAEVIDAMVKQTAARTYKFKQAVSINPTSSWTETFFREDPTVLTAQSGNPQNNLAVGAVFPQATVAWEKAQVRIVKFGIEDTIPWENILASQINIQARTVIRLTESIVKSVDDYIWEQLTQGRGVDPTIGEDFIIQSYAIATSKYWNGASAAIINDILGASQKIAEKNYDTSDLIAFVSPRDKRSIMYWLASKGAQWTPIATDIAQNGRLGTIAGVTIVESQSVTASFALVVKPKTCATYNELVSLRSTTVEDPYRSTKIRVVEEGSVELTDPKAIVLIKGTQGVDGL